MSDLLRRLLEPPPKLLFRERQLEQAADYVKRGLSFKVVGVPGVGKTTLVLLALRRYNAGCVYVSCFQRRTPRTIIGMLDDSALNVIDDFSLAVWTADLLQRVQRLPFKVLVELPHRRSHILENRVVEMPPYTREELEEILRERVVRLCLPLDDEDIGAAAEEGARRGGNARVALLALYELVRSRAARWA